MLGGWFRLLGILSAASETLSTSAQWHGTFSNDRGVRYMRKGMICDFFDAADTAIDQTASSIRIAAIDPTTKIVHFEAGAGLYKAYHPVTAAQSYTETAGAVESGSHLVRQGARAASHSTAGTPYEITGLNGLFDDGTLLASFQGQTISSYPEFVANIIDNSAVNRELSIDLMLQAMDLTSTRSDQTVEMILTGLGQRRKYFALLANDVRYAPGQFVGGYETLQFAQNGQVTMKFDPHAQPNRMYFMPADGVKKYELTPIGWGGMDDTKMHWRQDYDQATMFLRTYTQLGVEKRNALTLLDDLTEPTVNVW